MSGDNDEGFFTADSIKNASSADSGVSNISEDGIYIKRKASSQFSSNSNSNEPENTSLQQSQDSKVASVSNNTVGMTKSKEDEEEDIKPESEFATDSIVTAPAKKKQKTMKLDESWGLLEFLIECGVSSSSFSKRKRHDEEARMNNKKVGCFMEADVTPSSIRASIHALLKEMDKSAADEGNSRLIENLEEFIAAGNFVHTSDSDGTNNENSSGENQKNVSNQERPFYTNELLYKMLLPLHHEKSSDQPSTSQEQNRMSKTMNDSSLIKILLRVDVLQPTLLASLLQKLTDIASPQDDEDNDDDQSNSDPTADMDTTEDFFEQQAMNDELPRLILSHIRWIDHVIEPSSLADAALECLSILSTTSSANCDDGEDGGVTQKNPDTVEGGGGKQSNSSRLILLDLIATLPDIVGDSLMMMDNSNDASDDEHEEGGLDSSSDRMETIFNTLRDVRIQDPTLLIPCLDAIASLRFTTEEQLELVIMDALEAMESVQESWLLPALCKFLMQNIPSGNSILCEKVIDTFRRLPLGAIARAQEQDEDDELRNHSGQSNPQGENHSDAEALMLEALSQGLQYRFDLTNILLNAIKKTKTSQHGSADVWLLMCCAVAPHNKTKVKNLMRNKAACGAFTTGLVVDAINGNGIALSHLFHNSILFLADELVRAPEKLAQDLGGSFYKAVYSEFSSRMQRQEIVGQLVIHAGSGTLDEIDVAMRVFSELVASKESDTLRPFLPFLTSLLDHIQSFTPKHLRRLFLLLFSVGGVDHDHDAVDVMSSGENDFGEGSDEVHIVIKKHLSLPQLCMKKIGIIGTVCFAIYRSSKCTDTNEDDVDEGGKRIIPPELMGVIKMLEMVHKSCSPSRKAQDKRGSAQGQLNRNDDPGSGISYLFDELCLAVQGCSLAPDIKEWIVDRFGGDLEKGFLGDFKDVSNSSPLELERAKDEDLVEDKEDRALLSGIFKNPRASKGELRFNIDKEDAGIYVKFLPLHASESLYKRESLPQQLCPLLRLLATCSDSRYGGDGLSEVDALLGCPLLLPDEESSGIGFEALSPQQKLTVAMCTFHAISWCRELINAFVYSAAFHASPISISEAATQLQDEFRSKLVEKLRCLVVLEEDMQHVNEKCVEFVDSMKRRNIVARPLNSNVCLALGFSELKIASESNKGKIGSQELMQNLGPSELRGLKVGGPIIDMLLTQLWTTLTTLYPRGKASTPHFFNKQSKKDTSDNEMVINIGDDQDNPYNLSCGKATRRKEKPSITHERKEADSHFFLDMCISGDVFNSVHEHLATVAEICGSSSLHDENDVSTSSNDDLQSCTRLLLKCVSAIIQAEDLFTSQTGKKFLEIIVKQLANGQSINIDEFHASLHGLQQGMVNLFDLIEEIVMGGKSDDLDFVMEGVKCLDAILNRVITISKERTDLQVQAKKRNAQKSNDTTSVKCKLHELCLRLLSREWNKNTKLNMGNVGKLVSLYLEHSCKTRDLKSGNETLDSAEWGRIPALTIIIDNILRELPHTDGCKGPVDAYPTCCYGSFRCYYSAALSTLPTELSALFESPLVKSKESTVTCLEILKHLVLFLNSLFDLTKENPLLAKRSFLLIQLKTGSKFMEKFIQCAVPFIQVHFDEHEKFIKGIIKSTQIITRQMNAISAHGKREKDANLAKEAPRVRKVCETFIHKMKSLLRKNGVLEAFWGGNLRVKNIDGSIVQHSESEDERDDTDEKESASESESESSDESDSDTESEA